jgi:UDP-3-O-[3-hydroxymyristoyl] N-acetylglucosamine deacetylase
VHNQNTVSEVVTIEGVGLHSGSSVKLEVKPAEADRGLVFIRSDLKENNVILGSYKNVTDTKMCTLISNEHGAKVGTIEHLMAALWALKIDNAIIDVNAAEIPVLDGSSKIFMDAINKVGIKSLDKPRKYLAVKKEVTYQSGDKLIKLSPSKHFEVNTQVEFAHPAIGKQSANFNLTEADFYKEISFARTFGFIKEVEYLKSIGLAKGASLENAIGFDEDGVVNPEGLRAQNEIARHKILDCIGDLYLCGHRLVAKIEIVKAGHELHNKVLHELFKEKSQFIIFEAGSQNFINSQCV